MLNEKDIIYFDFYKKYLKQDEEQILKEFNKYKDISLKYYKKSIDYYYLYDIKPDLPYDSNQFQKWIIKKYISKYLTLNNIINIMILNCYLQKIENNVLFLKEIEKLNIIKKNKKVLDFLKKSWKEENLNLSEINFKLENYLELFNIIDHYKNDSNFMNDLKNDNILFDKKTNYLNLYKIIVEERLRNNSEKELYDLYNKIKTQSNIKWNEYKNDVKIFVNKFEIKYSKILLPIKDLKKDKKLLNIKDLEDFAFYNYYLQLVKERKIDKNLVYNEKIINKIVNGLEFSLTEDQKKYLQKYEQYCIEQKNWSVLLQGDVGSGKTILSILTAINYLSQNKKVLIVVPIKELQKQHYLEYKKYINKYTNCKIGIISNLTNDINSYDIIVGGTGLVNCKIENVDLIIFDEPHLLGIKEKNLFSEKFQNFDVLMTTATPQPRTQVMSLISTLDMIQLKTMPKGRKQIITKLFSHETDNEEVLNVIQEEIKKKNFIFVVINRLENSDNKLNLNQVYDYYANKFPNIRIAKMSSKTKEQKIIEDIKKFKYDMLISTNIIKVGIDIPHATCIIIHYSGFMGVSDLHQLRGRVGRNSFQSYCFIDYPNGKKIKSGSAIDSVLKTTNNLKLSEMDLMYRGIYTIIGEKQSGGKIGNKIYNNEVINLYIKIAENNKKLIMENKKYEQNK